MTDKSEFLQKIVDLLFDRKTDSISVSRTSTGKFSWETKIYTDSLLLDEERDRVLARLKEIHGLLAENFKDRGAKDGMENGQ